MPPVGEAVDARHGGGAGEGPQPIVAVGAEHDGVDVARGDARGVFERLAARDLRVLHGEGDGVPAELADGRLERDARARRGLLEEQEERPALQGPLAPVGLQLAGAAEERAMLLDAQIAEAEEVPLHRSASFSSSKSCARRGTAAADSRARAASCASQAIWSSIFPVPPAFRLRATEARGSAAASASASKRASIARAISSVAFPNATPPSRHRCTSCPLTS